MKPVVIYTTGSCPYCIMAKRLLDSKSIAYEEIRVDLHRERRKEMEQLSHRTSVPQIFIGDYHVGGFDDLQELEYDGDLDDKLKD